MVDSHPNDSLWPGKIPTQQEPRIALAQAREGLDTNKAECNLINWTYDDNNVNYAAGGAA